MTDKFRPLTDDQWNQIKHFFRNDSPYEYEIRNIFDAIRYQTRTGCQWRNLPNCYPPFESVYYYFRKWKRSRLFEQINDYLNRRERVEVHGRADNPSLGLIDSQSVKLSPMIKKDRGTDGGKKVNGRKRTILTDTLGRVWRCEVHAANVHDGKAGTDLIQPDLRTQMPRLAKILGDSSYNGYFRWQVEQEQGVDYETPQREHRSRGFVVQVKRWVVERSFAWWNFFRRLVKDYERTTESSEMFVYMANIEIVLHSLCPLDKQKI